MMKAGAKVQNLLTKGSLNHLTSIEENPEQHFAEIAHTIALAQENDIDTISIWKTE
jgi:D-citramalate synthase